MNKKKWFGIFLIVISLVIAVFNLTITGAVVGSSVKDYLSLISVGLFVGGVVFVFLGRRDGLEKIIDIARTRHARKIVEREEKAKRKAKSIEGPKSVAEAVKRNMLSSYLAGKTLISETNRYASGEGSDKHTKYVGRDILDKDFLDEVEDEAQFLPGYTLDQIRDFERSVALKGKGKARGKNGAVVYGISEPKKYGPSGGYDHQLVFGLAVDLQEREGGIYIHSYPVPIKDIPKKYLKKIRKKNKKR